MTATKPIFIRPSDFPAYFGISRSTAFELIKKGTIPARKAGRSTLILVEDIERYLKSLPVGVGEAPTAAIETGKAKRKAS